MSAADGEAALRAVLDPELGVNVVDLGLVYGIDVDGRRPSARPSLSGPRGGELRLRRGLLLVAAAAASAVLAGLARLALCGPPR